MTSFVKTVYENCECTYTCGLSIRKFLRLLSVIGMISSIVYITVGACIIAHIVQTEKVEWFPNAYYRIPEANGPVASRIVVPPPPPFENRFQDYEVYRPRQNYHPGFPFRPPPHYQHGIFPVNDDSDVRLREQQKAIYYRRNVGLFICLAATLIVINAIQLITDISLFYSTLKGKRTTSFWVFFLMNIILWIMSLICFITIFSGGGIFLLLVFLSGTAIRVYTVYALHELMSDLRKPRASSATCEETEKEIRPEPRTATDTEAAGNSETQESEETTNASDNGDDDDAAAEVVVAENADEENTSSTKSLQPAQDEDEAEQVNENEDEELQSAEQVEKADENEGNEEDDDGEVELLLEPGDLLEEPGSDKLEDILEEPEDGDTPNEEDSPAESNEEVETQEEAPQEDEGNQDGEENGPPESKEEEDTTTEGGEAETAEENEQAEVEVNENDTGESFEPNTGEGAEQANEEDGQAETAVDDVETEVAPDGEKIDSEENVNVDEPDVVEPEDAINQENEQGEDIAKEGENEENEPHETDSPAESGENEEQGDAAMDETGENEAKIEEENDSPKKRKKSKRKRRIKKE